jgi:NCS1 family nucleobase:cation symporter-1
LIADYWIIRKRQLSLGDLYLTDGRYGTWNWAGIAATLLGCALAWGGLIFAPLRPLYDYAWFVGFAVSALAYVGLTRDRRQGS